MATGLKSRVIYKEHTADGVWTGEYKLLVRAKSIPSPIGAPNMVDTSTLEDMIETQEMGRKSANSVEISGAMEKKYMDELFELEGKRLDFMNLYGTDGVGSIAKFIYEGAVAVSPDEASDDHLTMTATVSVSTSPKLVTDDYKITVTEEADGTLKFTVANATD